MSISAVARRSSATCCVARARPEGLFSNVATVIGMLHQAETNRLPPVVKFDSGLYLDPSVGDNWWEYYFEPVSEIASDEVPSAPFDQREMERLAGSPWYLGLQRAGELVAKYVRPRPEIVTEVDGFFEQHFGRSPETAWEKGTVPSFLRFDWTHRNPRTPENGDSPRGNDRNGPRFYVVGVHIRGTDKETETGAKLTDATVVQTVADLVRQIRVPYRIFVASDEARYISLLKRAFGDLTTSYAAIRSEDGAALHHAGKVSPWRMGKDAVLECLLLARCDFLIGSRSNLSMLARCFHPEMPHVCLHDCQETANRAAERVRHVPSLRYPRSAGGRPFRPAVRSPWIMPRVSEEPPVAVRWHARETEHVIVIPYYSLGEMKTFERLAKLWRRLPAGDVKYRFLVSARFDAPEASEGLLSALRQIAPVETIRCPTPESRFPDSATAMFHDSLDHVRRNYWRDGGFALWLEPDMVPLRPNWLADLESEWQTGRYTVMGRYVKWPPIPEHINGGACYAKDFLRIVPRTGGGWDVSSFPFVRQFGFFRATELIEFRYTTATLASPPTPGAAIMHGVKDHSVFDYVERVVLGGEPADAFPFPPSRSAG